jgi:hypothetical protein
MAQQDSNAVAITGGTITGVSSLSITGLFKLAPSSTQTLLANSATILANASMIVLDPNNTRSLTSEPTIADGVTGQVIYLTVGSTETYSVTLQDQDVLAGSNLQVDANSVDVTTSRGVQLIFNGATWVQVH